MSSTSDLRGSSVRRQTRRALMGAGASASTAVAVAACGLSGSQSSQKPVGKGTEVLWGTYLAPSDPRADMVKDAWRTVENQTGLKITVVEETSNIIWDRRQTEFAAGTTAVDICYLTTAWVVPGGLRGMFVDLNPLAKRDKYDLSQYYKGAIDTWSWKGHLWALAFALGFEAVLYNKSHFLDKGVKLPTKDWTYDDFLAAVGGNSWAIMGLSKVRDAAWEALKANHSKEALLGPQIGSIAWPPTIWAANSPQWLDQFKGTHVVEAQEVAQKSPHDYMIVPEGQDMLDLANAPMNRALKGEISATDAMKQGADAVNALFARRPPEWR